MPCAFLGIASYHAEPTAAHLKIAVHDGLTVQVLQRRDNLGCIKARLFLWQPAFALLLEALIEGSVSLLLLLSQIAILCSRIFCSRPLPHTLSPTLL